MKRTVLLAIGALVLSIAALTGVASATTVESGDSVSVPKEQVLDSSYYAAGNSVIIDGTVRGDVYCAGQNIIIAGTVEGDVLCTGQNVRITGIVDGDLRVAGQNVTVSGTIRSGATVFGQEVSMEATTKIGRDLTLYAQNSTLDGEVTRDIVLGGETAEVRGIVGRDLTAEIEQLSLEGSAKVVGNLHYTSHQRISQGQYTTVMGATKQHTPRQETRNEPTAGERISNALFGFTILFASSLVLWLLLPKWFTEVEQSIVKKPWLSLGVGFGALILTPFLALLLLFTLFGIPLGLMLATLWGFALFVSSVVMVHVVGAFALRKMSRSQQRNIPLSLLVGALIVSLLTSLPYIGGWAGFAILVWGMGGLSLGLLTTVKRQHAPLKTKSK